jgi:hypothetical protein
LQGGILLQVAEVNKQIAYLSKVFANILLERSLLGSKLFPVNAYICIGFYQTYTLRSSLISPASFVRFSRPFPGGTTELFEEMAIHECDELKKKGTGLMEWLFTHPEK